MIMVQRKKALYRNSGATWSFAAANPAWTGLSMTSPVSERKQPMPLPANQTQVTFTGDFQGAKEHNKISIRANIYSSITGSNALIASQEFTIRVVTDSELPTGIDPATQKRNPAPLSYAFADIRSITQADTQAYGPVKRSPNRSVQMHQLVYRQYQCTCLCSCIRDADAPAPAAPPIRLTSFCALTSRPMWLLLP